MSKVNEYLTDYCREIYKKRMKEIWGDVESQEMPEYAKEHIRNQNGLINNLIDNYKETKMQTLINGLKVLSSKRAYALAGVVVASLFLSNTVAVVTVGVVAMTYIICETKRKT